MNPITEYLSTIARRGGASTSPAKVAAARRNLRLAVKARRKARAVARSRAATDAADAIRRKKARRHARIAAKIAKRTKAGAA